MAETLEHLFWIAASAWVWIVFAVMALGPVVGVAMIRRHNAAMRKVKRKRAGPRKVRPVVRW